MTSPLWRVGVDTGGTFTDVVLTTHNQVVTAKVLSTPENPGKAVLAGIRQALKKAARSGLDAVPASLNNPALSIVHGSTVATNALLEGKHGRTALLTTAGFEDLLSIARQNRPSLYALSVQKAPPPIAAQWTLGVQERVLFDGSVERALTTEEIDRVVEQLQVWQVDSVVLSFLHSYANPHHEQLLATRIRQALPDVLLTASHELLPEFREYERTSTCTVNALVAPAMNRYLRRLEQEVGASPLRIMASAGGTSSVSEVCRTPVATILSGPAGGVRGAETLSRQQQEPKLITLDMGGTSTDVALCDGGVTLTSETVINHLPVRLPMLAIHTVGAGGGSIAWVDAGGALRVGPQSAGASPGPAAYGRQNEPWLPTVTDAHVVLGRLPASLQLGGQMSLQVGDAKAAVASLAEKLGLGVEETAEGILRVADVTMLRAVQKISVQQGHDPRDFVLVPFGGAGGLHACRLAEQMGIRRLLLPRYHGLLSALGMLFAPPSWSTSRSLLARVEESDEDALVSLPAVQAVLSELEGHLRFQLQEEGFEAKQCQRRVSLDLRYAGQSYEISTPVVEGIDTLQEFQARHRRLYGYLPEGKPVEIVTVRLELEAPCPRVQLPSLLDSETLPHDLTTPVWSNGSWEEWSLVEREKLVSGQELQGPLLLVEDSATTVVEHGWYGKVLPAGHLQLWREES